MQNYLKLTKNQIGALKMSRNNKRMPLWMFIYHSFDNINIKHKDKVRQLKAIQYIKRSK